MAGVEINAGYTREINFELSPGIELEGVVVEYERPLIQNDAIGVPNVTTAEDIVNLPVRGVANVAALQGGVVKEEGSDNLYIRGGREQGVSYYVDGVKVVGDNVAVSDAGRAGARNADRVHFLGPLRRRHLGRHLDHHEDRLRPSFFGTIEGISSEVLDSYGYNQISGTLAARSVNENVSFFLCPGRVRQLRRQHPARHQLSRS